MAPLELLGTTLGRRIDKLTDRLTSYRLVLYSLIALLVWALVGSSFGKVSYSIPAIVISAAWISAACFSANRIFAWFMGVVPNKESSLITGLILTLILTPPKTDHDFIFAAAAAIVAMASKYALAIYKSHIFNPAAAGAFFAGELFSYYPSWWVGTKFMAPAVIIIAILILRKMKRTRIALAFLAVYALCLMWSLQSGSDLASAWHIVWLGLLSTPVIFFASIMLTEPLTSPTNPNKALVYAVVVAVFYSVNRLHASPEAALLIGNLVALAIAYQRRYSLGFLGSKAEGTGIYSYTFEKPADFSFQPGQYMEWTLDVDKTDSRGNRRYFSISSAPSEDYLMLSLKLPAQNPSLFKQRLASLGKGERILAGRLGGTFTLPPQTDQKLAFIAGGIGITPFRSMVKSMLDKKDRRDIELVYASANKQELAFTDLFSQARSIGLKPHYVEGTITSRQLASLDDYKNRRFYVSGPYSLVQSMEEELLKLGIKPGHIHTDYFPGYA